MVAGPRIARVDVRRLRVAPEGRLWVLDTLRADEVLSRCGQIYVTHSGAVDAWHYDERQSAVLEPHGPLPSDWTRSNG